MTFSRHSIDSRVSASVFLLTGSVCHSQIFTFFLALLPCNRRRAMPWEAFSVCRWHDKVDKQPQLSFHDWRVVAAPPPQPLAPPHAADCIISSIRLNLKKRVLSVGEQAHSLAETRSCYPPFCHIITFITLLILFSLLPNLCHSLSTRHSFRPRLAFQRRVAQRRSGWMFVCAGNEPANVADCACSLFICEPLWIATATSALRGKATHLLPLPKLKPSAKWVVNVNPFPVSFRSSSTNLCRSSPSLLLSLEFAQDPPPAWRHSIFLFTCRHTRKLQLLSATIVPPLHFPLFHFLLFNQLRCHSAFVLPPLLPESMRVCQTDGRLNSWPGARGW